MKLSNIRSIAVAVVLFLGLPSVGVQAKKFQTRCGWLDNPTMATYSLSDKL